MGSENRLWQETKDLKEQVDAAIGVLRIKEQVIKHMRREIQDLKDEIKVRDRHELIEIQELKISLGHIKAENKELKRRRMLDRSDERC